MNSKKVDKFESSKKLCVISSRNNFLATPHESELKSVVFEGNIDILIKNLTFGLP